MDTNTLLLGLLFGTVGFGMFTFGRKAQRLPFLIAGLVLMVCPYFIPNPIALTAFGAVLTIAPFFLHF